MTLDWLEEGEILKDVWKCVIIMNGRLSVMEAGVSMKQELCVDSLDSQKMEEVS